jgi:hypothetical protein
MPRKRGNYKGGGSGVFKDKTNAIEIAAAPGETAKKEPVPSSFDWIEKCLQVNGVKTCEASASSSNFNRMILYVYDVIPMVLVALLKRAWRTRVNEMMVQKSRRPGKVKQLAEDAAKILAPWPIGTTSSGTEKDFIAALLGGRQPDTNAFRKAMLVLCNTRDNFYFQIDGEYKETWAGKKLQHAQEQGISNWDMPLLKNMLLYYNIGFRAETVRPLLRKSGVDDETWQSQVTAVRELVMYRNMVSHQASVNISAATVAEMKAKLKSFVAAFFDKERDKPLLDVLAAKESDLEGSRFLF